MTVQELIEALKAHPPAMEVRLFDWTEGHAYPCELDLHKIQVVTMRPPNAWDDDSGDSDETFLLLGDD